MEVKLDKKYPVAATVEQAWAVLADVRATAACMPGAQITEQDDDTHYKGVVKSKVGPATMTFNGTIEVLALDAATRTLRMLGSGADRAGSSASMDLTARVVPVDGGGSVLEGGAVIKVNGKLAQFGNRLLVPVADAMLAQFADRFRAAAAAVPVAGTAPAGAAPVASTAVDAAGAQVGDTMSSSSMSASSSEATTAAAPDGAPSAVPPGTAAAPPRTAPTAPAPAPTELNALSLIWAVIKGWFAGLFGKRA
ncbi:MAG: SRPBCC family protein [Burkholderiaceae bacterium]|jgi:carbon monoxide dehydrogenase subunit G|nr:SRPBCC family protein [Burkholderiales bacterium]MCZ8109082.1 SRPBCC family protein [Burkholderiales bacterium]MCZ8338778.1 SRPBCC family protein [Burkholderiaceae bacterium]